MYKKIITAIFTLQAACCVAQQKDSVFKVADTVHIKELEAVSISTGYQQLPRERATGAFSLVSDSLFNKQVGSGILPRLEGAVSGLLFAKTSDNITDATLRSRTTFGNKTPLVVVDNFIYEGDLNNLNPADVESITVLKDAAAASIWGARSGNGVIVIKTRKGSYNKAASVSVSANTTLAEKSNLFYNPQMSVREFVAFEKLCFERGMYTSMEQSASKPALSPVVELLIAKKDGLIAAAEADRQIEAYAQARDVREQYRQYYLTPAITQRYAINLDGGNSKLYNYFSVGYDAGHTGISGNTTSRLTLNYKSTYTPIKNLEINSGVFITNRLNKTTTTLPDGDYPYEQLADASGTPLVLVKDVRNSFKNIAAQQGLLNWEYRPLAEIKKQNRRANTQAYVINAAVKYQFGSFLSTQLLYQYEQEQQQVLDLKNQELYYVRNLINQYTQQNSTGTLSRPLPLGSILTLGSEVLKSSSLRHQYNFSNKSSVHKLFILAGAELRQTHNRGNNNMVYGYNEDGLTVSIVDHLFYFPLYYNTGQQATIPSLMSFTDITRRYLSAYANGSYTYYGKWILSASVRTDGANIFGVKTNQRWKPLWSTGISWLLHKEDFYKANWLPQLKLRLTYGYTGSIGNGSSSAYTTATYGLSSLTQLRTATISQPPNPGLRWEKHRIINSGVDFELKQQVISGSIDVYYKKGIDLFSPAPLDPTTGFFTGANYTVQRNYANITGKGIDVELNSINTHGMVRWSSRLLFSYSTNKITRIHGTPTLSSYLNAGSTLIPQYAMGQLFSYKWGGLDSLGNPQGYIDGKLSTNYSSFATQIKPEELVNNGPSVPPFFGALGNQLNYKKWSLSFNILYKLGHYFRRNSFVFGINSNHADYALRWQQPGDELRTHVPSLPTAVNSSRNSFYANSEILVEKASHIRLQYVNVAYHIKHRLLNGDVFLNAANLGILWKAGSSTVDPDYGITVPPGKNLTLGLRINFN